MDYRLESVDRLLAGDPPESTWEAELAFAIGFARGGANEPNELRWLAACAAARAQELEDEQSERDAALIAFAKAGGGE